MNAMPSHLTPIKVRGRQKKKKRVENPPAATTRSKGGRPLLSRESLDASRLQARMGQRAKLDNHHHPSSLRLLKKSATALSTLERLPVELLEKIFLSAHNVAFPRASPVLAAAVSTERVYRGLILLAFWSDQAPAVTGSASAAAPPCLSASAAKILRPLEDVTSLGDYARRDLQAAILRCRWCTFKRLSSQLPDLLRLSVQRLWLDAEDLSMKPAHRESLARFVARESSSFPDNCQGVVVGGGGDDHLVSTHYTLSIQLSSARVDVYRRNEQLDVARVSDHLVRSYSILDVREFPAPLLCGRHRGGGGFSEDDLKLLELLRVAGGMSSAEPCEAVARILLSRDALLQGLRTALVENNARALGVLLKIDEFYARSLHKAGGIDIGDDDDDANAAAATVYTVPADCFRTAVRVARDNDDPAIFQLLVRASAESVPADDPEITQWAMSLDSPFGSWLLDLMMMDLPHSSRSGTAAQTPLFYMGRASTEVRMSQRYLAQVLQVDRLDSWMDESILDIGDLWRDAHAA